MTAVLTHIVREGLLELSDAAFQRRVWTGRGRANEMSSFEECVSHLFDDSGLEVELERGRAVFGPQIDADLHGLRTLLQEINALRDPDEIVDDPLMEEVRQRARAILKAIARSDYNRLA